MSRIDFGFVYIIKNLVNEIFYIGGTNNIIKRKSSHFNSLRKNKHYNKILQKDFNDYGESNFIFIIIETSFDYIKREGELISSLDFKNLYNINNYSSVVNKANVRKGQDNPNWRGGKKNYCQCGKIISSVNKNCTKCRDRTGKNNPFYGKKHTKETIEKLKKRTPNFFPSNTFKIEINKIIYNSYKEAERALNIKANTIRHRCNSLNEKYLSYNIVGKEKDKSKT